jgi:hypothetical protein
MWKKLKDSQQTEIKTYRQKGINKKYPTTIWTWKLGDDVPEWLSDIAKVKSIVDGTKLDLIMSNTGGYEIKDSGGIDILVRTKKEDDLVCMSTDKTSIFSLSQLKFKLLYERES